MDNLSFVANVIDSIAWPLTSIVIVILLKEPIVKLLRNIRKLKYKDAEFDFGKEISKVPANTEINVPISNNQLKLAELSPRGAVLESWLELEDVIENVMVESNISSKRPGGIEGEMVRRNHHEITQLLLASGRLSSNSYEKLQKLRRIRNKAVHLSEEVIESNEAEAFIRLIEEIKLELKNA